MVSIIALDTIIQSTRVDLQFLRVELATRLFFWSVYPA